jgi:general stress protein YciG
MAGTQTGGLKAAKTNKERYGDNYYAEMGRKGGKRGHGGGFASNPALARMAGAKGGSRSKRAGGMQKKLKEIFEPFIRDEIEKGSSINHIATKIGVSSSTIKRFCENNGLLPEGYTPSYRSVKK